MQAGLSTLTELERPGLYDELEQKTLRLVKGLREAAAVAGIPVQVQTEASMFTVFFKAEPVVDFDTAGQCNMERFARFHQEMLSQGVYWPPSQMETCFVSAAHGYEELDKTVEAASKAFRAAGRP